MSRASYEWNGGCCPHDNYVTEVGQRRCLDCGETEEIEAHYLGCCCATCSQAELTADNE